MFYLYKKTHLITGLMYLGFTRQNPYKYHGSGVYWKSHIKAHGNQIHTEILKECTNNEEIKKWGEHFSQLWDVVNSTQWANLKPETGEGGCPKGTGSGRKQSEATKAKISKTKTGKKVTWTIPPRSEELKAHLSRLNTGKIIPPEVTEKRLKTRREMGNLGHTDETKKKMRKPKSEIGRKHMKQAQQQRRAAEEKLRWITNGIEETVITISDVIPEGWLIGRLNKPIPPSQKGKIWVNNGVDNKKVGNIEEIPDGWVKGMLINKNGANND